MKDLNLNEVHAIKIKPDYGKIVHAVQTKSFIFYVLESGKCVKETISDKTHNNSEQISHSHVCHAVFNNSHNMLFMSGRSGFETYNVGNKEHRIVSVRQGFDCIVWNANVDKALVLNNAGFIRIINFDPNSPEEFGHEDYCQYLSLDKIFLVHEVEPDYKFALTNTSLEWSHATGNVLVGFAFENQTYFQIYDSELRYYSTNVYVPHLVPIFSMRPDCSVVVGTLLRGSKPWLMFFEKNGLHKSELKLKRKFPVKQIKWNSMGDILLVQQHDTDTNSDYIMLHSYLNDIWFIKQTLHFINGYNVVSTDWLTVNNDHINLQVITNNSLISYNWNWTINVTRWSKQNSYGILANTHGKKLFLTALSKHRLPSPLCSQKLKCYYEINFVKFSSDSRFLLVIFSNYTGEMYEVVPDKGVLLLYSFNLNDFNDCFLPLTLYNFVVEGQDVFYSTKVVGESNCIMKFVRISDGSMKAFHVMVTNNVINYMLPLSNNELIVNSEIGVLKCIMDRQQQTIFKIMPSIPHGEINVLSCDEKLITFSLKENDFYVNGMLLSKNVSSYLIADDYLLFIMNGNTLYCMKINDISLDLLCSENFSEIYSRTVPQGSYLITPIPDTRNILLENTRGDYEIIQPRILSIGLIEHLLAKREYKKALKIIRHDRINPNIIVDANPQYFFEHVEELVKDVKDPEQFCMFIVSLTDNNICAELYPKCFENDILISTMKNKKINTLNRLIEAMIKIDEEYYISCIVTGYVAKGTEEGLQNALTLLKQSIQNENSTSTIKSNDIFTTIITLTSVKTFFDTALSMKDFDLIYWSAPRTSHDPLEYMPFIKQLQNMETNYCDYKIKRHLKKYDSAFLSLIKCNDVENELYELLKESKVYKLILKHVDPSNQWYVPLLKFYAKYLRSENQALEAGYIYKRVKDDENALDCFIQACHASESLSLIHKMRDALVANGGYEETLQMLGAKLVANKRFKEASLVYEQYLADHELAIKTLIKGQQWSDAVHYISKFDVQEMLVTDLKPALEDHCSLLCEFVEQRKRKFEECWEQLYKLRAKKIDEMEHGKSIDCTLPDNFMTHVDTESLNSSFVSSLRSSQSKLTNSSRLSKKREKNIMKTKPGSQYENIALIRELHMISNEVFNTAMTVNEVCTNMVHSINTLSDMYTFAYQLHMSYSKTLEIINNAIPEIWCEELNNAPTPPTSRSSAIREYYELLDMQYRVPPSFQHSNWKVYSLDV